MAVELPKVEQDFEADVAPYVAAIEEMIAANERFLSSIEHVQEAIDALHGKDVEINLNAAAVEAEVEAIKTVLDSIPDHKNVVVTVGETGEGTAPGNLDQRLLDSYVAEMAKVRAAEEALNHQMLDSYLEAVAQREAADRALADEESAAYMKMAADIENFSEADRVLGQTADVVTRSIAAQAAAMKTFGDVQKAVEPDTVSLGQYLAAAGVAAYKGGTGWAAWNGQLTLWAGLLPGILGHIRVWHAVLDAAVEATVALTAASIALGAGIAAIYPNAEHIADRLGAIYQVSTALGQSIPPLNGKFADLQKSLAPQTIELYGGALNALNSLLNSGTSPAIQSIVHMFNLWMANIDIYLGKQSGMNGVLRSGQGFLQQFASFIGEVGIAINNLIKADPGTAHFLLDLFTGFGKLLDIITSLPTPILQAALALHSIWLWGGLLATQVARLLGPIAALMISLGGLDRAGTAVANLSKDASGLDRMKAVFSDIAVGAAAMAGKVVGYFKNIGTEMIAAEGAAGKAAAGIDAAMKPLQSAFAWLAANPFVVLIAGLAAAAYGYTQLGASARSATGAIVSSAEQLPASQAMMGGLASAQGQLIQKMHQIPGAAADAKTATGSFAAGVAQSGNVLSGVADVTAHWIISMVKGKQQIDAFQGGIVKLTGDQTNLFHATGDLVKQGFSVSQSWALMDLAGVKAGDTFQQMTQEVQNLIKGYQNLGIQGGLLGNAVNAVTFATEMQDSKVQQVTQAFSQFIQTVTGGQSAFISFAQQVQGTFQAAGGAAATLSMRNGQVSSSIKNLSGAAGPAAVSMNGLTTSSLNLRQSFIQSVQDGSNVINTLLTLSAAGAQGAKGTAMVTQAGKDLVAQMLPLAKGSHDATTELYTLAQTAGYQGANSFQALAKWVGNVKNPMENLNSIESKLMGTSATLSRDVQNLANAIGQSLNQAMAAAIFQAHGGQAAFNNFANAVVKAHGNTSQLTGAASALASELVATTGSTSQAKGEFETFAGMLGINKSHADALWASVVKLSGSMNAIPNIHRSITITESVQMTSSANPYAGGISGRPGMATGGRVPGFGGGDTVPALLEPGEAVVPKHLTSAVAPFLKAHGVPGFASGGPVGAAQAVVNAAQLKETAAAMVEAAAQHKETVAQASVTALEKLHHTPQVMTALKAAEHLLATDKASLKSAKTILGTDKAALASANAILFNDKVQALGGNVSPGDFVASLITGGKTKEALAAITQDAGMLARFFPKAAIPKPAALPPQFMSDYAAMTQPGMPSLTLRGSPAPAGGMVGGQTPTLTADHPAHIEVKLDGKTIWRNQQQLALKYSLRNNGVPTGLWKPK